MIGGSSICCEKGEGKTGLTQNVILFGSEFFKNVLKLTHAKSYHCCIIKEMRVCL